MVVVGCSGSTVSDTVGITYLVWLCLSPWAKRFKDSGVIVARKF